MESVIGELFEMGGASREDGAVRATRWGEGDKQEHEQEMEEKEMPMTVFSMLYFWSLKPETSGPLNM